MNKKVGFIGLAVLLVILLVVVKFNNGAKTMEEAITTTGSKPVSIIHEEKTKKGSIVFSNHLGEDSLSTAFVKKGLGGYKTMYSGVQSGVKLASETLGLTHQYFPSIKKTSLPIYFGVIGDPDVMQVKVVEKKRNIEAQATIIQADDIRIWLVFMNKFEGSHFELIGLSKDGAELVKIEDDISPNYADQKPFKSYY